MAQSILSYPFLRVIGKIPINWFSSLIWTDKLPKYLQGQRPDKFPELHRKIFIALNMKVLSNNYLRRTSSADHFWAQNEVEEDFRPEGGCHQVGDSPTLDSQRQMIRMVISVTKEYHSAVATLHKSCPYVAMLSLQDLDGVSGTDDWVHKRHTTLDPHTADDIWLVGLSLDPIIHLRL